MTKTTWQERLEDVMTEAVKPYEGRCSFDYETLEDGRSCVRVTAKRVAFDIGLDAEAIQDRENAVTRALITTRKEFVASHPELTGFWNCGGAVVYEEEPTPDVYECDNCGELFTPEQFADITANDLVVMWCEECEQSYLANEAWADKRACPECGNQHSGARVERLPANGCPHCIQGELQARFLPEL